MNIDGHVLIELLKGFGVGFNPAPAWHFAVLDAGEFVVLDPKVGLEYLERRWEPEQSGIACCYPVRIRILVFVAERFLGGAEQCGSGSKRDCAQSHSATKGSARIR